MTPPTIRAIRATDDRLIFELDGDRQMSLPISISSRLTHATPAERDQWTLDSRGIFAHWPAVDEDIAIWEVLGISEKDYLRSRRETPVG